MVGVDSRGILVIHPERQGEDASKFPFVREAIKKKHGYTEYKWKNPRDKKHREKAAWYTYFEPGDLIIWATSYKDEFIKFIDFEDLRKKILSIKLLKTGYIFVLDNKGKFVIHPETEGVNWLDFRDKSGRYIW